MIIFNSMNMFTMVLYSFASASAAQDNYLSQNNQLDQSKVKHQQITISKLMKHHDSISIDNAHSPNGIPCSSVPSMLTWHLVY